MENETIRGRIQNRERRFQDMGFLKALESRVMEMKAAHDSQGPTRQTGTTHACTTVIEPLQENCH